MKPWGLVTVLVISVATIGVWVVASNLEQSNEATIAADSEAEKIKEAELDPVKQKRVWDAEHISFEIEQRFGKMLLKGLKEADRTQLLSFFRNGFQGTVPETPREVLRTSGLITEVHKSLQSSTRDVNAEELVTSLLASVAGFKKIERAGLRVLSIERIGESDRWKTRLLIKLGGIGKKDGPRFYRSEQAIEFLISDDMEIDKTPAIDRWDAESETLRTSSRFLMEEVTEQVGLAKLSIPDNWDIALEKRRHYLSQTAVADYDQDGDLDVAIMMVGKQPIILESNAGKDFRDVAEKLGVTFPSGSGLEGVKLQAQTNLVAGWFDFDNDSFPDLLLGERIFHNIQGKNFEDITFRSGLTIDPECMGCIVGDYDCDGLLDIYLLYQKPTGKVSSTRWVGDTDSGVENQLWRNEGGGRFRNVTQESGGGGGKLATHAAAWFYLDEDHYPDLYIANDFGKNVILRNRGDGTFEDVSKDTQASDFATSMGVAVGDINNDGKTDIYVANMYSKMGRRIIGQVSKEDYPKGIYEQIKGSCAGNRLYLRGSDFQFQEQAHNMGVNEVGWAYAPAMTDLNGDGWLDLYATTGFMSANRGEPDG